jgi:hypothetical protein
VQGAAGPAHCPSSLLCARIPLIAYSRGAWIEGGEEGVTAKQRTRWTLRVEEDALCAAAAERSYGTSVLGVKMVLRAVFSNQEKRV